MSASRRSGGEINILAMLDGQTGRTRTRPSRLPPVLRYGAAGMLACLLVGVLAWLAHDAEGGHQAGAAAPALALAGPGPAPVTAAAAPPPAEEPKLDLLPAGRATIVDVAPAASANRPDLPRLSGPEPVPTPTLPPAAAVPAPAAAPAHDPAPKAVLARASAAARPAAPARPKRAAPASTGTPAPVDTDVALISAIIRHGRAEAASEPACADKSCAPRMPDK